MRGHHFSSTPECASQRLTTGRRLHSPCACSFLPYLPSPFVKLSHCSTTLPFLTIMRDLCCLLIESVSSKSTFFNSRELLTHLHCWELYHPPRLPGGCHPRPWHAPSGTQRVNTILGFQASPVPTPLHLSSSVQLCRTGTPNAVSSFSPSLTCSGEIYVSDNTAKSNDSPRTPKKLKN